MRRGMAGAWYAPAAVALALLTATSASAGHAKKHRVLHVAIRDMKFVPATIEAAPGDTVVWTNEDLFPHTVTAQGAAFDSGAIAAGAKWKLVVKAKGAFHYACSYHPAMKGLLIVK